MTRILRTTRGWLFVLVLLNFASLPGEIAAQQEQTETEQIADAQKRLSNRYKLLEDKLFTLYEFERDNNPLRSKILKRAFQQSQERMTASQFRSIVELLNAEKLKDAEARQANVLKELQSLLDLLESEDRGKRVRDELKRHKEYLKEVERLLRIQRGIRGQASEGGDQKRLAKSQQKAAERTGQLADDIQRNEEEPDSEDEGSSPIDEENETVEEGSQNADGDESKSNPANSENKQDGQPESDNPSGAPGQPSEGQDTPFGQGQDAGETQPAPNQTPANPVRQRIEAAEERMRRAQQNLDQSKRDQSVEDMIAAEAELAAARRELEEILRQLREEEVERVLAKLETRFRQMLEREVRVYEKTRKLDSTPEETRDTEFEIQAGRLSVEQNSIATEASRALMLLQEDGSSVAFPETVEQLYQDMLQIAQRLSAAKTGQITIEIEEDVIETLEYLIQALVVAQQDLEKMKQQQSGQPQNGQPGQQPLVDSLAELKMLRGLQERIYRRHKRYSKLLTDPQDSIGSTTDPDLQRALERLSLRQQQLTDIARDIVVGKNQK